jgi:hypothetical protein
MLAAKGAKNLCLRRRRTFCQRVCTPWTPVLPTPVGFGFASVLGPTHGRVANVGYSPLLLVLWGHIPHNPLPWGLRPPGPPVCPPPSALGLPAFWAPPVAGLLMWATRSLFCLCGGTPPTTPCHGGFAPLDPPFAHPRGLWVCQRFGSHSWRGC